MGRIELELRKLNREKYIKWIKESKGSIAFIVILILVQVYNVYRSSDVIIKTEEITGVLVGLHQKQSNLGSTASILSIKLDNGIIVNSPATINFVAKINNEVLVTKNITEQGNVYYYFQSYIHQSANKSL